MTAATRDLEKVFAADLEVEIARGKDTTVASSLEIARRIVKKMAGTTGAEPLKQIESLGVDFAPAGRGTKKAGKRMLLAGRRAKKLRKYTRALPRNRQRMSNIYIYIYIYILPDSGLQLPLVQW